MIYMVTRHLESLLITIYNRSFQGWSRRRTRKGTKELKPAVPADYAIIGHVLRKSETEPNASQRIVRQSNNEGLVVFSPQARRRHVYVLGASGSGKTNLLLRLIESDIKNECAFCVIDLRGDLVDRILLRLAATGPAEKWRERLLLLDLREQDQIVGFNPLLGESDSYGRAMHLLSVIKSQSDSFGVQLEETLRNCLIALAETGWSPLEIEPLLTSPTFRDEVLQGISDSRVKSFFERFNRMSNAKQTEWSLSVLNKITPLLSVPQLRLVFGQRQALPFRALLDQQPGLIVLVSLAVDRLHEAGRLAGGLIISSFQSAIMARADQPENERVPVHLHIDEFETMASDRFETIVAEGRRFGLGLTLCHQNTSQLGSGLRHVLRNNVHTQVYFQTGALDAADLAREISGDECKENVKATLMSQSVGQAYLVRRGEPSTRVQVLHCPDPVVDSARVRAVRTASYGTYARAREEVEEELVARESHFHSTSVDRDSIPPVYEIRHAKTTQFKPSSELTPELGATAISQSQEKCCGVANLNDTTKTNEQAD